MTTSTTRTTNRIPTTSALRGEFAGCSTDGKRVGYYETKGHAIRAFEGALLDSGLCFDLNAGASGNDFNGDDGRTTLTIIDTFDVSNDRAEPVGRAILSWYRMPSGRYEFTGYIA